MIRQAPIQVGVTGGIGSGKSVVCRIFQCLGISIYEADERARWLTNHDPLIRQEVTDLLGPQSYAEDGSYNRPYVASRVFSNASLLQQLNQIIHPRVFADTDQWLRRHQASPYVIKEAALMNKAGDKNTLDYVVVVTAPLELRIARVRARDHRADSEIRAIIERQVSEDARLKLADFVVENDSHSALIPQVLHLHDYFCGRQAIS
jgi:dephospho-CoA kinase